MPRVRTPTPRAARNTKPEAREAGRAMLWRFGQIRAWKEAVHAEAWRQAIADGSHRCGPDQFDAAGARLIAAGVKRPPEDWFDELREARQWLARQVPDADPG